MIRDIDEIIADFQEFTLDGDYLKKLRKLTDEILEHKNPERALPAMLSIFERYPEEELGSPGPLVHAIEKCREYEDFLLDSLERQPGTLTVWMLRNLIKYDPKPLYIDALRKVLEHPKASEQTREDASLILSWTKVCE